MSVYLRIPDINEAKIVNKHSKAPNIWGEFFDNLSIDGKSEVKVEKHSLVAEVKWKTSPDAWFTFSISAQPLEVTFQMSAHFLHLYGPLVKKKTSHNFETRSSFKIIKQNVKDSSFIGLHVYQVSLSPLVPLFLEFFLRQTSVM